MKSVIQRIGLLSLLIITGCMSAVERQKNAEARQIREQKAKEIIVADVLSSADAEQWQEVRTEVCKPSTKSLNFENCREELRDKAVEYRGQLLIIHQRDDEYTGIIYQRRNSAAPRK